jgi:cobalt-zinc-cadmium efflux system outer membrane protein
VTAHAPRTRTRVRLAVVALAFFASAPASAAPLSWRELAERQRRENTSLLAAKHRLSQARADILAAGVWSNPNVSATALLLTHGAITGGRQELTFSVDQTVPIAGQIGLRENVARGLETAEERAFAAAAWQLAGDGRAAYVELQRAQGRVRLLEDGLKDLARVESVVSERAAGGAGSAYDKVRVAVERSKVEARLAQARVEHVAARTALALLVGKSVDAAALVASDALPEVSAETATDDALVARALAQRPETASARARTQATELRVALLRRQVIPSPTLTLGYARYLDVPDAAGAGGGALLAGLSLPIPLLDRGQGRVDRGLAEAAEVRAQEEGALLGVRRDVEQAAATLRVRASAARRFQEQTAPELPRLRTVAELAYREGRATILELLDAYASHLDAEERRLDLAASAVRALADLARALGPSASAMPTAPASR